MTFKKTAVKFLAVAAAAVLALSACGETSSRDSDGLIIGTTDKVVSLDPAGSFDHGSLTVEIQVYSFLYAFVPGYDTPQPDAAEKCEFVEDTVFECVLKPGLKFANGNDLTASDVKFSYDRIIAIDDPVGPGELLENLDSVEVVDDLTVRFNLTLANDQTFAQVIATSAGPIVDEDVFPADALLSDEEIVDAQAFSGPYTITSYIKNDTIEFTPYEGYIGAKDKPANEGIIMKTYADASNLRLAITKGDIDVVYRSITPTDIESLQGDKNVTVWNSLGGEIRYIVFNFDVMPGDTDEQKLAIRQAIAASIDRDALATQVYKNQYTPLCSYVPDGFPGATTAVCDRYGSAPDVDKARAYLEDAGVEIPVALPIQYNPDHYGSSSAEEYGLIKQQLESTGLFTVDLQASEWVTYNQERKNDTYPIHQLGWFPDYPDADNYLSPFFRDGGFLMNHFSDAAVNAALDAQLTELDPAERTRIIEELQGLVADQLSTLPLLQGSQWAFTGTDVTGIILGVDDLLHFGPITKG